MDENEALERIFQLMHVPAGQYDMAMKRVSINDEGFTFTMWAEDVGEEDAATYTMRWAKAEIVTSRHSCSVFNYNEAVELIELIGVGEKPVLVSPIPTVILAILYAS